MAQRTAMLPTAMPRGLGLVALASAGGAAAWWLWTRASRGRRSQLRTFMVDYDAVVHGLSATDHVRARWRARLAGAQARFGDDDGRTLTLRCRLMAFDELAGDEVAAAEQVDAVVAYVGSLDEQTRWLFVVGLHWLAWRTRRRPGPDRCRPAFENLVGVSQIPLPERISVGVRLAHAAAQGNRMAEARWILERACKALAAEHDVAGASPYRDTPGVDDGSDAQLAFEVRCERVRIEINASDVAQTRAAMAELEQWVQSLPHAADLVRARTRYWLGMSSQAAGAWTTADRVFGEAADAFARLNADDESVTLHTVMNLVAWIETLLHLHRPDEAATLGRRAQLAARTRAERGQATGVLAAALVHLGQDEEAEAVLSAASDDESVAVGPTRALLALRRGELRSAQRWTRRALAAQGRNSPWAAAAWLTLGRVLVASGRPRMGARAVAAAAAAVIAAVGPAHPRLADLYRFLAERRRASGQANAASSLDAAADHLLGRAADC